MSTFPGKQQGESFDSSKVEPAKPMEVLPAGKYLAIITKSDVKRTKADTGSYLSLMFKIVDGEYKNRVVWCNLNLDNPNATAVGIAERDLSAICNAIGIVAPEDTSELHGIPLQITVAIRKATSIYPKGNDVKGYVSTDFDYEEEEELPVIDDVDDDMPF